MTEQEAKDLAWRHHLEQEYEWLSLLSEQKVIEYRRAWEKTYQAQTMVFRILGRALWEEVKKAVRRALG